ncbi:MAG: hypothetical protein AVDCRST_MAG78-122 [uncultured Rubrobacteraceae bacterium]|uniref:Uncharacterized protein n=1 Tax=uncultured Rubrobacteraceae bacterium TaxID=349277 RepID=A0A6J4P987_9ACTN|nr:MAG: hypothetical protein AVDCRST_MAG78-122 [uncultured Rubrobacteraceae bacterium]
MAAAVDSIAGHSSGSLRSSPAKENLHSCRGLDRNPSLLLF